MDRIPVVIVELAKKGEDKNLFWDPTQPDDELDIFALVRKDVDIKKIGDFGNHLSSRTRPLYVISKKEVVHVAGHTYGYDNSSIEAYKGSPLAHRKDIRRKYFFADDYIVKEYGISAKINPDNLYQIMTEINTYVNVLQRHKIYHTPKLIDFEINENEAKLVVERIPGTLLSDVQEKLTASEINKIAKDILKTLSSLEEHKLHHNDVRSWNVIFNKQGAWLIDYGYTGPVSTDDDIVSLLWLLQAVERGERESYQQGKTSLPKPEDFKSSQLREMCSLVKKGERSATKLLAAFK